MITFTRNLPYVFKIKSSSFLLSRINKLDCDYITCLPFEKLRDIAFIRVQRWRVSWIRSIPLTIFELLYVSEKLPTYPSPNPTFCPKWEISVKVGLGEGQVGSFTKTFNGGRKATNSAECNKVNFERITGNQTHDLASDGKSRNFWIRLEIRMIWRTLRKPTCQLQTMLIVPVSIFLFLGISRRIWANSFFLTWNSGTPPQQPK